MGQVGVALARIPDVQTTSKKALPVTERKGVNFPKYFTQKLEPGKTPYDEIAEVVGKSPAAVRQIAHRARDHVAERRPRMLVDRSQQEAVLKSFMAAITSGDLQGLVEMLAPDVVLIADGGGLVRAARKPLIGAETVVAFLARVAALSGLVATAARFNGMPGARFEVGGEVTVVSLVIDHGQISRIYAMRNPSKLGHLEDVAELRR